MSSKVLFIGFQLIAGGGDAVTGIALMAAPSFTLKMMGVRQEIHDLILVSFIGAFVLAVGLSYLAFASPPRNSAQLSEVRAAWLITALVRLCVGVFVAAACASQRLDPAWLTITAFDLSLATFQLIARRRLVLAFA